MRPVSAIPVLLFAASILAAPARAGELRNFEDAALHAVQFVDKAEGWAVGDEGVVWHTIDAGKVWERMPSGVRASLRRFASSIPISAGSPGVRSWPKAAAPAYCSAHRTAG